MAVTFYVTHAEYLIYRVYSYCEYLLTELGNWKLGRWVFIIVLSYMYVAVAIHCTDDGSNSLCSIPRVPYIGSQENLSV